MAIALAKDNVVSLNIFFLIKMKTEATTLQIKRYFVGIRFWSPDNVTKLFR